MQIEPAKREIGGDGSDLPAETIGCRFHNFFFLNSCIRSLTRLYCYAKTEMKIKITKEVKSEDFFALQTFANPRKTELLIKP